MNATHLNPDARLPRTPRLAPPRAAGAALAAACVLCACSFATAARADGPAPLEVTTGPVAPAPAAPAAPLPRPPAFDPIAGQKPSAIVGLDLQEQLGKKIPLDTEFFDHTGNPIKLAAAFNQGRPVLLALVYHRCPLLCPAVLSGIEESINRLDYSLGDQYTLVIASFDSTETPATAKQHRDMLLATYGGALAVETPATPTAAAKPASPQRDPALAARGLFTLATKSTLDTRRLADALGFPYRYIPESNEFAHPAAIFVLTPDGTISRYLYGVRFPAQTMRLALVEAGQGKIGSIADRFMLWCSHWDRTANGYSVSAFRWMQLGAGICALAIGIALSVFWLGERTRRRANRAKAAHALSASQTVEPGAATAFARADRHARAQNNPRSFPHKSTPATAPMITSAVLPPPAASPVS